MTRRLIIVVLPPYGDALAAQLNSFTGGCEVFNGVDGFAAGSVIFLTHPVNALR
jgi:hypothetical protein